MDSPVAQAIILGVLQGLTEFLPVSSSGHLALAQQLIPGFAQPGVLLDVMLHVGTLAAVLVYFRRELGEFLELGLRVLKRDWSEDRDRENTRLAIAIVVASVPTALIGIFLEDRVEALFESTAGVGAALLVTGAVLVAGEMLGRRAGEKPGNPGVANSFLIGIAQGIAVIPGVSRSGSTISVARALGIDGTVAARFSFLVSLPAVAGAALLTALKHADAIANFSGMEVVAYLAGPLAAGIVGYFAIGAVMRVVKGGRFMWFSAYCFALGLFAVCAGLFMGR